MKKNVIFLLVSLLTFTLSAQTIPDGSFETGWTEYNYSNESYWDYENSLFYSLNELYEEPLINVLTTYRETEDVQSGNYAIRLVSKSPPTFIPGAIGTISPNFIEEFLNNGGLDVRKDFVFLEQPVGLMGYYKYIPVAGDSAAIDFAVYHGETEIATNTKIEKNMISTWKEFYLPLTYQSTDIPNKVKILFVASAGYDFQNLENCKGRENSTLYIDNIAFAYASGMVEPLMNNLIVNLYPNPANHYVHLNFENSTTAEIQIFSIAGALVKTSTIRSNFYNLDVENWENGTYFYRIIANQVILAKGKFIVNSKH